MKIIELTCPSCGANLDVDVEKRQAKCPYCSAVFPVDDEAQHIRYDNAEQAGYEFEKGRQRAQAELDAQSTSPQYQSEPAEPKRRRTWLWVLGWLFAFPIPLTILVLRNKRLGDKARIGIIVAAWVGYLIWIGPASCGVKGGWDGDVGEETIVSSELTEQESALVIEKISGLDHIQSPTPVTKYHDPNRGLKAEHGYVAAVYFTSDLVDTSKLPEDKIDNDDVIDVGTDGGGCIEVYRNEADATKRDRYLGRPLQSIAGSGSHSTCGRYLIRTSSYLTRSQQKQLERSIRAVLIPDDGE
ncbi:MAG: hypothetical protein J6D54_12805 [Olsenella sp.]|nr:hypothetical protein [Olsenella sp.]